MFKRIRIKYASKFGRIEHKAGRIIAIPILIGLILNRKDITNLVVFSITLVIWAIYLFSHTLEKKIYGKHGFR